jgi:transcription initiation factor IIE alpha subunit
MEYEDLRKSKTQHSYTVEIIEVRNLLQKKKKKKKRTLVKRLKFNNKSKNSNNLYNEQETSSKTLSPDFLGKNIFEYQD